MGFENSFNEDLAREMAKKNFSLGLQGNGDAENKNLDDLLDRLKSRALRMNEARELMASGFEKVLKGIKHAYPELDLDDPNLQDTPNRVARAYLEIFQGLGTDTEKIFSTRFPSGSYDEVVMLKDIPYTSLCSHHFFPFIGRAHIGYLPDTKGQKSVVGLSKLARVVDAMAQRPQLQERMCTQIMETIQEQLRPRGVMVVVQGKHSCLGCRGAKKPEALMVTSSLSGAFKENAKLRNEFLTLLGLQQ